MIHTVKGFGIVNKTEVEVNMKMGKNLKEDKLDGNVWDVNELGWHYFFFFWSLTIILGTWGSGEQGSLWSIPRAHVPRGKPDTE